MKPLLNLKSYTVTRTTLPNPVNGRAIAGTVTTFPITANIHDVNDRTMMTLPEERRTEDVSYCFTSTKLVCEGELIGGTKYKADRVLVNGVDYEVFKVSGPWSGGHFRAYLSKRSTP